MQMRNSGLMLALALAAGASLDAQDGKPKTVGGCPAEPAACGRPQGVRETQIQAAHDRELFVSAIHGLLWPAAARRRRTLMDRFGSSDLRIFDDTVNASPRDSEGTLT